MRLDRGYLDALRAMGLAPVEVAGCWTRGYDLVRIGGSLDHHTAGARTGYWPSGPILTDGRSDLPGPLCNTSTPRAAPGDFTVYFVAAGKANHAGAGRLPVDPSVDSNYELLGLERELVGDGSDLTPHRHDVACRVHAATLLYAGLTDVRRVVRHATYATPAGRKIDTAGVTDSELQGRVAIYLANPGIPTQEVDAMEATFVRELLVAYSGYDPNALTWDKPKVAAFDYHLYRLITGQTTKRELIEVLANTARQPGGRLA